MKRLTTLTFAFLIGLIAFSSLYAQEIDQERMQRDINIMESILEEMFKSEWSTEDEAGTLTRVKMHSNGLSWAFGSHNTVEGSYFTGYGALFMITGSKPVVLNFSQKKNAKSYFRNAGGDKDGTNEINRESIINRISEFLMDYGSTINQLKSNEKVTVVYKANNFDQLITIVRSDQQVDADSIPSLSVSATVADLQAYRKGQIGKSSFSDRLNIHDINTQDESERKLRVMSKILQASFDDNKSDNFEIDNVNYLYLEGFGAIFESKASYGSGLFGLNIAFSKLRKKFKDIAASDSLSVSFSDNNFSWSSDDTGDQSPEEVKSAYNYFISTLKETVLDYGQTLSPVLSDENILISLSISGGGDVVPERMDLRIKKSVLEGMDDGNISREQAMEQITVREY